MISIALVVLLINIVVSKSCYWNDGCSYQLFSSKTPYDSVRGDIRDYPVSANCRAISLWSLNRHGNRNPGGSVTDSMRVITGLKDEIIQSHQQGRGELCAQDIDNFKKWKWNETLDVSTSDLTGTGYEELYDIAKRLREKYPHLLEGGEDDFYFRTTNEQRTITSSIAFVRGWSEKSNLSIPIDGPWDRDDIIRPYENCDRYQQEVKNGQQLEDQLAKYFENPEFVIVQNKVQRRLGLTTQLSSEDIYSLYEICRFYRSNREQTLKSPWCSAFSNEDLEILEYRDDVRHYHRNGYGSWVNVNLGGPALKDLYDNFETTTHNQGKNLVAYFTHDTMIEMVACAMGLFKDNFVLEGGRRDSNRLWRTSHIGSFAANILAVLNECTESENLTHRVQIFVNEKVTELCPLEGCTWQEFQNHFQKFTTANLDFCSMEYKDQHSPDIAELILPEAGLPDGASVIGLTLWVLIASLAVVFIR